MSKEEKDEIIKERDLLLEQLNNCDMPDSERRFVLKKIKHITDKLLEKVTR
jgi:hypothetical protein